ncbi:unnamed protein product [Dovyalis caffra]|uniref:Uncharacterized protein n=1 Tax=Dovyalis caffra TaxID=77055 RepID=A0AAV1QW92_9ROSI|nr:unnamed protein product [Dovyalis caffra]
MRVDNKCFKLPIALLRPSWIGEVNRVSPIPYTFKLLCAHYCSTAYFLTAPRLSNRRFSKSLEPHVEDEHRTSGYLAIVVLKIKNFDDHNLQMSKSVMQVFLNELDFPTKNDNSQTENKARD